MQYIEASVIGIRSAVITLKRRATPLSFVVFPMVHVGEPEFFRQVAEMARECDLIVAEGAPSAFLNTGLHLTRPTGVPRNIWYIRL